MIDTLDVRRVIERALENARKADLSIPKRIGHALRAVLQMRSQLAQEDAVTAVRRVQRP